MRSRWISLALLVAVGACTQDEADPPAPAKPEVPAVPAELPPEPSPEPEAATPPEASPDAPAGPSLAERLAPPPDVAGPPDDAEKTKSGIASKVLVPGTGDSKPGERDTAIVHYTAWTNDGAVKDSTWKRGEPRTMKLHKTMASWAEAIRLMTVGEKRRVWIPADMALKGKDDKGTLVIDLELIGLHRAPPAPADVARPPKDAKRRPSGLVWKTLKPGSGTDRPTPTTTVSVRYTGWTTDGKCFDQTLGDETATFDLASVIPGWTEGIPQLVVGEQARFWIPEKLAYAGKAGKPKGMLVFDVELVTVEK